QCKGQGKSTNSSLPTTELEKCNAAQMAKPCGLRPTCYPSPPPRRSPHRMEPCGLHPTCYLSPPPRRTLLP
ncbi:hypothetical protein P7K49_002690, partial [Saguinus oedipus]